MAEETYLRYVHDAAFGVIASSRAPTTADASGQIAFAPAMPAYEVPTDRPTDGPSIRPAVMKLLFKRTKYNRQATSSPGYYAHTQINGRRPSSESVVIDAHAPAHARMHASVKRRGSECPQTSHAHLFA